MCVEESDNIVGVEDGGNGRVADEHNDVFDGDNDIAFSDEYDDCLMAMTTVMMNTKKTMPDNFQSRFFLHNLLSKYCHKVYKNIKNKKTQFLVVDI